MELMSTMSVCHNDIDAFSVLLGTYSMCIHSGAYCRCQVMQLLSLYGEILFIIKYKVYVVTFMG